MSDEHAKVEERHREAVRQCLDGAFRFVSTDQAVEPLAQLVADRERDVAAQARREGLREAYVLLSFAENQEAQAAAWREIGKRIECCASIGKAGE